MSQNPTDDKSPFVQALSSGNKQFPEIMLTKIREATGDNELKRLNSPATQLFFKQDNSKKGVKARH